MKTEPQYGEPWTLETFNSQIGNTGDYEGIALLRASDGRIITQQVVEDEDDPYMTRIRDAANLLAGHDLSTVTIVDNAVLEEVRTTLQSLYDDTDCYADGTPDATAHDKMCNEVSTRLKQAISKLNTLTP